MTQKWFGSLKIKVMLYVTHKEFEVSVLIRVCVCSKSLKSNWSRQIAALPSAWLLLLPVKRELFPSHCHQLLAHMGSDCCDIPCFIAGSLSCNVKFLEVTVVVTCSYIKKNN